MSTIPLPHLISSLGNVSPETGEKLATYFTPKIYPPDYFLVRENEVSNEYCLLGNGLFRAYTFNTDGEEVTTNFFTSQQIAAEPWSFFTRVPARENIHALTQSEGWCISFDEVQHAFHTLPEFREFGRRLLLGAYVRLKERMLSAIHQTAEQRYLQLLSREPDIFKHARLRQVASYLGVTDSSLSRIRKEISKPTH
ncbi:MAG: Crp/Fnr family transcriptional regulator [Bacteroidia bacterium]|jgi:CRP-like cAMP-binding protein|nr:Crp/Fnr family transcriptional regulator [Bacteroidia bacterium]